nr:CopG family transcriptional regulator [Rhizobium leguminosarum]
MNYPNVEKISVSMTPHHAELLRDAVAGGASQVIREAMRDWSAKW